MFSRRVTLYLTTATKALQDHEHWEQRYCSDVEKAYKPPDRQQQAAQQQEKQQAGSARQRIPPLRRPVEHPMWRNMRTSEVRLGPDGGAGTWCI